MMHSCGHPAARRQRCSHAPIPSRQPRSICTSTWFSSRARDVRECCVLSLCVTRLENLSYDHFMQQTIFRRNNCMGWTDLFFSRIAVSQSGFHVACSAPRRRRVHPRTDSIFSTLGARRDGHGARARARARLAAGGSPVDSRRASRAAPRSAARCQRENAPPVEKNTIFLCYTRLPFTQGSPSGSGMFPAG